MERLIIGFIRSSFGVEGKLKAESTSGETEHFSGFREVTLRKDSAEKTFTVESAEPITSGLILKLGGIDSPEEAKKYSSWEIVAPRNMACPLSEDEFYVTDLCQCSLVYKGASDGAPLTVGMITGVMEGGSGDLLEVMPAEGGAFDSAETDDRTGPKKRKTVLIPFRKEFIGATDMERKTVQLTHLWILDQ